MTFSRPLDWIHCRRSISISNVTLAPKEKRFIRAACVRFASFPIFASKVRHLKWARAQEKKLERFHSYARPLLLIHYNIAINSPLLECLSIRLPFDVLCCAALFYFPAASIAKTLLLHSISSSNMLILFRNFWSFFYGRYNCYNLRFRLQTLLVRSYPPLSAVCA